MAGEEEGHARREVVYGQAGIQGGLDVGDGVGQGERHLLHGGGSRLAHVVAGDGDGVPAGGPFSTVGE